MAHLIDDEAEGANLVLPGGDKEATLLGLGITPSAPRGDHLGEAAMLGEEFGRGEPLVWLPPLMQEVFSLNGSDRARSCVRPSVVAVSLAAGRYGDLRIRSRTR